MFDKLKLGEGLANGLFVAAMLTLNITSKQSKSLKQLSQRTS